MSFSTIVTLVFKTEYHIYMNYFSQECVAFSNSCACNPVIALCLLLASQMKHKHIKRGFR